MFWNHLAQVVGYLTLFGIAAMILYVFYASARDAYRDSAKYKRRKRRRNRKREEVRIRDLHNVRIISPEEAKWRLDKLAKEEEADV